MRATERFEALVRGPDDALALDDAALCMAAHAHPGLDIDATLGRLDELAAACPGPTLDHLLPHLFGPGRFTGDTEAYDDPSNSFLDDVLDRRRGLPITLSLLAMEVGRRIGVPLDGVGMPGHFLVRDKVDRDVFADPFHGGRLLDAPAVRTLFATVHGSSRGWRDEFLDPVPRVAIVRRMLENLKGSYARRHDLAGLRWVLRLRTLLPDAGDAERAEWRALLGRLN